MRKGHVRRGPGKSFKNVTAVSMKGNPNWLTD
jgi:hypothetical protein